MALLPVQPVGVPVYCTATTWARCTAKIVPAPGCHFWVGALADDGYRRCTADGRGAGLPGSCGPRITAPLPQRVVVLHHSCDEPSCARLDHRRAGSQTENLASATGPDRPAGSRHTARADRRADGRCGPGLSGPP